MDKDIIKRLILEYQQMAWETELTERELELAPELNYVLVGLRRAGKSYLLYQQINKLLSAGHQKEEILFFNFEDDRLLNITLADLDLIKTCYEEMFPHRPIFFLDEIQNVKGWEHFARRLADQHYRVYITGSNANMLSIEIAGTLGGRFMIQPVTPYSFREYLAASGVEIGDNWIYSPQRTDVVRMFDAYFRYGGLPEVQALPLKMRRAWIANLYNKIFFGDILMRYSVRNTQSLKIMIRKLAESVKQPLSFSRLANIISSTGTKTRTETVIDYIGYAKDSCLIFDVENYAGKIVDREMNKKYYFADNGLLNLFLMDPETSLLENLVAIYLHKLYDDVCFYNDGVEVDFYLWEHQTAIQVAYSLKDDSTRTREISALQKLSKIISVSRRIIITYDEAETIEDAAGKIEVIPIWQWLLS